MPQKVRIYPIVSALRARAGALLLIGDPRRTSLPLDAPTPCVSSSLSMVSLSEAPLLAACAQPGGLNGALSAGQWESELFRRLRLRAGSYTLFLGVEEWTADGVRYQWGLAEGLFDFEGSRLKLQEQQKGRRMLLGRNVRQGIRL